MSALIGGYISLGAVMKTGSRKIEKIYFDKLRLETVRRSDFHAPEKKQYALINEYAAKNNTPIEYLTDTEFDALSGGEKYGGIAADVGDRVYENCGDIIDSTENGFFVMLDGIEDPFNFAYVLRTLYATGVDAVFLPERNFLSASSVVIRSSAGASEYLRIGVWNDSEELMKKLKSKGVYIACTAKAPGAVDIGTASFKRPLCIVIGGEKRGVNKTVMSYADKTLKISYAREASFSLSASSAAAIIAYQVAHSMKNQDKSEAPRR